MTTRTWLFTVFWDDRVLRASLVLLARVGRRPERDDLPWEWFAHAALRFGDAHPLGFKACSHIATAFAEGQPS